VTALAQDLVYTLPRVEVVALTSKTLDKSLPPALEYYQLVDTPRPANLLEALAMFRTQFPDVVVLERAVESAKRASDFREPRLALWSLHFLRRVYVEWADARRRDRRRSNHVDLQDLRHPAFNAMRELLQNAQFSLSDDTAGRRWECSDGRVNDFRWHMKWSLASLWGTDNHCRIHYAFDSGTDTSATRLYIGHCGEHL
jgi:hypothetical protein